ncbi:hypothetical protein L1049_017841 [Liquidambar formosana]|uniref:B-like cyclin n=1 Tax=Liquidambar formosana TaxID=63359 RepID=A0AAP0NMP8_LIQFO
MNKENIIAAKVEEPTIRITRARVKALGMSGGILRSSKPSIDQDQKPVLRANSKRAALDENKPTVTATAGLPHKRRAVLKDVTNIVCENSYTNCINAAKIQPSKQAKRGPAKKNPKVAPVVTSEIPQVQEDTKLKIDEETSKTRIVESQQVTLQINLKENVPIQQSSCNSIREFGVVDLMPTKQTSRKPSQLDIPSKKDEGKFCDKLGALGIADIDSNQKDPQMCSLYASGIYNNLRVTELERRPSPNFMETVQRDINQIMRGILVDWLVEVSEEYKLVPDTLYLTVNLIDRFLSENYIEKQRLQLLGVTCMLIASKYEEICAPHVEEFCFITDNTYTKGEVLKMESRVLNFLHFQLSVPTTKTFLRRSIQAAQACYKVPCVELEFLANYLAELTLTEYSFLKFLPSLIAASAVFLARWTLDQAEHPWHPTLEHYTSYKAPELKTTILAMQDLQLNTNNCTLKAIREKYRQQKFKCVATLSPSKPVQSLF